VVHTLEGTKGASTIPSTLKLYHRKLSLAVALIGNPKVLFLDEVIDRFHNPPSSVDNSSPALFRNGSRGQETYVGSDRSSFL
jgi:hypothetical protein